MDTAENIALPDEIPIEAETTTILKVNFMDGTITDKVQFENEGGLPKFFRELAKYAKKTNVKSAVVLTVDEDNSVDWIHISDNIQHLALAALYLDDIKEGLKRKIFDTEEDED